MPGIPIRYRDFYDIPRAFLVERAGLLYFFDCPFDDGLDEYPDFYRVYRLGPTLSATLDSDSWQDLARRGSLLGELATRHVRFDETRRAAIDDSVFELL